MAWLVLLFFGTAALYASVGFGGGSTYIALLALTDVDYQMLPVVALLCNIIVVSGGTWRFHQRDLIAWDKIWPILLLSVPAAWLGGRMAIDQNLFLSLLGLSLLSAALLLLIEPLIRRSAQSSQVSIAENFWFAPTIGAAIGFVSGMVGIGGGIFLAPILLLTKWGDSRRIAATASLFILVNSLAGLIGQMMKSGMTSSSAALFDYWPIFIGVLLGGQLGSILASKTLPETWIRRLTAILILYVAGRILWFQWL